MKDRIVQKICKHHGLTDYILEGRGSYRCKACRLAAVFARRAKIKAELVQARGGKCERCGYDKCIEALQFHHPDPTVKEFSISARMNFALKRIQNEAAKCVLVCANCHAEIHAEQKL